MSFSLQLVSHIIMFKGYSFTLETHQSYGALPAIWDHTVLPATQHRLVCAQVGT